MALPELRFLEATFIMNIIIIDKMADRLWEEFLVSVTQFIIAIVKTAAKLSFTINWQVL